MDAPNFPHSFSADIVAYFYGDGWSINVVENSLSFREIAYSILTSIQSPRIPLVLDGSVVVSFFLPPTAHNMVLIFIQLTTPVLIFIQPICKIYKDCIKDCNVVLFCCNINIL